MKKVSLKLQPVAYQVYRALSQLNRQFEEQIENLDCLISFDILPAVNMRAYQVILEEVRALINQELHEVLGERELHNSAYYENLRLKWQRQLAPKEKIPQTLSLKSRSGQKRGKSGGRKASRQRGTVRP